MTFVVYDGECPFCSNYVSYVALKKRLPDLTLVDARQEPDHIAVKSAIDAGHAIDAGMVVVHDGCIHHGADAMKFLANGRGVDARIFGSRYAGRLFYPLLRAGRNAVLGLLGKRKLGF